MAATVKLSADGNILLKDGRVSCTCCPGECCMWPAQALLDGLYNIEDLPETVYGIGQSDSPYTVTFERTGTDSPYYEGDDETRIVIVQSNNVALWQLQSNDNGSWVEFQDRGGGDECLVQEEVEVGGVTLARTADDYQDTYTVNVYNEVIEGDPVNTFTITRESLCQWSNEDGSFLLRYGSFVGQLEYYADSIWSAGPDAGFGKFGGGEPGTNDSPIGSYSDANFIWDVVA